jgi:hypothetical protein
MKKLWIVTGIIILVGAVAGGIVFFSQQHAKVISPGAMIVPPPTTTPPVVLATWDDPAGFSFQYPKDLTVNKHEDDNDNYAHVELTNSGHPGSVIVWASDPSSAWPPKGGTSIDTTLGGVAAKKILISTPSAKLIVGAVSEGLVFKIEGTLTDKAYWQSVEDGIVKTFAFTPDTSAPAAQSSSGDAVDETEVVQ